MINNISAEKKSLIMSCVISEIVSLRQKLEYISNAEIREEIKNKITLLEEILTEDLGE